MKLKHQSNNMQNMFLSGGGGGAGIESRMLVKTYASLLVHPVKEKHCHCFPIKNLYIHINYGKK